MNQRYRPILDASGPIMLTRPSRPGEVGSQQSTVDCCRALGASSHDPASARTANRRLSTGDWRQRRLPLDPWQHLADLAHVVVDRPRVGGAAAGRDGAVAGLAAALV